MSFIYYKIFSLLQNEDFTQNSICGKQVSYH